MLANQARSDPLTGLGNRRMLDERITLLSDQRPLPDGHALLYVDLDRFKDINDTYGHETGDLVLQYVAEALRDLANTDDTVIRLGGDEFVIVFGRAKRERVLAAGRAIVEHLSRPVNLEGATYAFGASVGIAFSENPTELLRQADVALYFGQAKGQGAGGGLFGGSARFPPCADPADGTAELSDTLINLAGLYACGVLQLVGTGERSHLVTGRSVA